MEADSPILRHEIRETADKVIDRAVTEFSIMLGGEVSSPAG